MAPSTSWNTVPGPLWVFAYGSLMWDPCFEYDDRQHARLCGYHRSLCIWSTEVRGTRLQPGLVLGLREGRSCDGLAFRIATANVATALSRLADRELDSSAYLPCFAPVQLGEGSQVVPCLVFVANTESEHFAYELASEQTAAIVSRAVGAAGKNVDYVHRCWEACLGLSIHDTDLQYVISALAAGLEYQEIRPCRICS
ncbi:gamma-glutamylcyclotransferase [Bradyrhizobium sp.]|jgi:glutathione-specific gamma-glutamylcyclotransferase